MRKVDYIIQYFKAILYDNTWNCHGLAKIIFLLTECSDGFYGNNCEKTCRLTCKIARRCYIITGTCNGGCLLGWKGIQCEHGIPCNKYCVLKLLRQKIDIDPAIHCIGHNCVNKVNNGFFWWLWHMSRTLHSIECKSCNQ